ncbi:hypothetical protein H0H92_006186 [Tricholoma furcatifolium]|nr:hypothetical protein H0H92_006186 [Tricholoma furcatifolium]
MFNSTFSCNRTLDILSKAEREGYGILAQICYDAGMVVALVRAAERSRSPAILQLFPVTLAYGRGPFLKFCLDIAHQASVPIAVHLDHATDPEHLELALTLAEQGIAFDSIMVDASHAETDEENIALALPYVERARKLGIPVEVELGRLEGGEAGLRTISDAKLTDPRKAEAFINGTGAAILAPSIGNLHGSYLSPPNFRQHMDGCRCVFMVLTSFRMRYSFNALETASAKQVLFIFQLLHAIDLTLKVNVNSWARDPYVQTLRESLSTKSFPDAQEAATEAFAAVCARFFILFGSVGKADV